METIETLSAANPYRQNKQEFKPSFLQRIWSALGGRTQQDAWRENMEVQADEYDAALAQKQFDLEYNDPSAQVSRMRAAGINPDLDGAKSISPGDPGSMGEDPSTPMQSTGDEDKIQGFISTVISTFSSAIGMVNSVQGIQRNHLQNSMLALQDDQMVADFADKMAPTFVDRLTNSNDFDVSDYLNNAYSRAAIFSRKNLPKKYRDRFNSAVRNFFSSAPGESTAYREWFNSISSSKDFYKGKNTFWSPKPETMDKIFGILGDLEERLYSMRVKAEGSELTAETAKNDFDAELYGELDSSKEAAARNAEAGARKNQADVTNILRGSINEILSALKNDDSDMGRFWHFLLRAYSLYMFSK